MNCKDAERSLSALMDEELDARGRDAVLGHLRECPVCRERLSQMENVDRAVFDLPRTDPGETFSERIAWLVRTEGAVPPRKALTTRIAEPVLSFFGNFFELLLGEHRIPRTNSLQEFSDFPPLSLSHAYFNILNRA